MSKTRWAVVIVMLSSTIVGCATTPLHGLRESQKTDLLAWEADGVPMVMEKSPEEARKRAFFLGRGAFYTDDATLGVIDRLTWPLSILWEPDIAEANANRINYTATKEQWMRKKGLGYYGLMKSSAPSE